MYSFCIDFAVHLQALLLNCRHDFGPAGASSRLLSGFLKGSPSPEEHSGVQMPIEKLLQTALHESGIVTQAAKRTSRQGLRRKLGSFAD